VSGNAQVYGNAQVSGNASVSGDAQVYGNAQVSGNASVSGDARVSGDAQVSGNARVFGNAWVSGDAWETSPLYIQGTKHSVTNCAHGKLAIGCQVHTFAEWKKNYKAIGKAAGYTSAQIEEYGEYIKLALKAGR
jgi:carbonic anhydrase/acetyltransferase-like protein (isoleucine patch superfamily)